MCEDEDAVGKAPDHRRGRGAEKRHAQQSQHAKNRHRTGECVSKATDLNIIIDVKNTMQSKDAVDDVSQHSMPSIDAFMGCTKGPCHRVEAFRRQKILQGQLRGTYSA